MERMSSLLQRLRTPSASSLSLSSKTMDQPAQSAQLRRHVSTSDLLKIPTTEEIAPATVHFGTRNGSKPFLEIPPREGSRSPTPPPPSPRDPLPTEHVKIDGFLNYHISQLDRIKREIDDQNITIEQLSYTLSHMTSQPEMKHACDYLRWRIQGVRNARNLVAKFVTFHLQEIERVSASKKSAGGRDVHDICRQLPSTSEWNDLFSQ